MLSQMQRLTATAEGRYATDEELRFLPEYLRSYELRMQTYQQIQKSEATILTQLFAEVTQQAPDLFPIDPIDRLKHCQQDVRQTLRYCATAVLVNDMNVFRERYLLWLQTSMRALDKQRENALIYSVLPATVRQVLAEPQAQLLLPLIQEVHLMLS
jgi:Phycobilisome protein